MPSVIKSTWSGDLLCRSDMTFIPNTPKPLTDLDAETAPVSTDLLYLVDDPEGIPLSKKVTLANVAKAFDHGAFLGLGDDDHTHYILADGTRHFTGDVGIGAAPSDLLHVAATGNANALRVNDTTGYVGIGKANDKGFALQVYRAGSTVLYLEANDNTCNIRMKGGTREMTLQWRDVAHCFRIDDAVGTHTAEFNLNTNTVALGSDAAVDTNATLSVEESSSSAAATIAGDVVAVERNGDAFINLLTPAANASGLVHSDGTRAQGSLIYDHDAESYTLTAGGTASLVVSGTAVNSVGGYEDNGSAGIDKTFTFSDGAFQSHSVVISGGIITQWNIA